MYILLLLILIGLALLKLIINTEYFTGNKDLNFYITTQKKIKKFFETHSKSLALKEYSKITPNIEWKIHRWSMWDYNPEFKYPYYCLIKTYLNTNKCIPITNKKYCSTNNIYKTKSECLNKKHNV
jgi:hypothetical protein